MSSTNTPNFVRMILPVSNENTELVQYNVPYYLVKLMDQLNELYNDLPHELPTDKNDNDPFEFDREQCSITAIHMKLIEEFYKDFLKRDEPVKVSHKLTEWDQKFFGEMNKDCVLELLTYSDYLALADLLEVACTYMATQAKGKSKEQLREYFNIPGDLSPEEEKIIEKELKWAEEINKE